MCGIFGIMSGAQASPIDRRQVTEAAMLMRHRGPDAYGQWGLPDKIELAHLRLSIIDLSAESNQPFVAPSGRYIIVFNGEIYNYIEIREELVSRGHAFRTSSDTEVLLNSYIEWGRQCVSRFNGDWAFAIYDVQSDILFCSRDRFGVKPFNYAVVDDQFIFSSEIKSIIRYFPALRRPNYNVIANYCRNGLGAQHEDTWFTGIRRLPPAHNLTWSDGRARLEKYWDYPTDSRENVSLDEATTTYRELFTEAVKLRMRSDVPVGTTLSSGIDSGSIVSVLRTFHGETHNTFTAVSDNLEFEKRERAVYRRDVDLDEGSLVRRLAHDVNLDAHMVSTQGPDFVSTLSTVIYHLESGHSSPATIPLYGILRVASKHVTVIMEGQGADELLGGYILNTFPALLHDLVYKGRLTQAWREAVAFRQHYSLRYAAMMHVRQRGSIWLERLYHYAVGIDKAFGPQLRRYTRLHDYPTSLPRLGERFNQVLCRSHAGGLVNLLHYGDALSLSNSLESRLPFMDVNLVEYCFRLPFHLKARNGVGKYIHRCAMAGIVPDYILDNPIKLGFNTPLACHFRSLSSPANTILLSSTCLARGTFAPRGLRRVIEDHIAGRRDNSTFLFRLLSVELWFRQFIDTNESLVPFSPQGVTVETDQQTTP